MVFSYTWDATFESLPTDSEDLSDGASRIRDLKKASSERMKIDHSWAGDANDGKHKQVTFVTPLASKPTLLTDEGAVYSKTVNTVTELFYEDDSGNEIQVTKGGLLNADPFFFGAIAHGTDAAHDLNISPLLCQDSTKAVSLGVTALQTKELDADWATGSSAGGLGSAPEVSADTNISFNNGTSKIVDDAGAGSKFNNCAVNDQVIVAGSTSNDGIFTITAVATNDITVSPAPVNEAAGASITLTLIKADYLYNIFVVDDGSGGVELGFDVSLTAAGLLAKTGGSYYRAIGYFETDSSANITASSIVNIRDGYKRRSYAGSGSTYTWRKPAMLKKLKSIFAVGSGQAGGGFASGTGTRAGGRAAASAWKYDIDSASLSATETVTVPPATTGTTANPGSNGSAASFGSILVANGGTNASIVGATGADYVYHGGYGPDGNGGHTAIGFGGQTPSGADDGEDGYGNGSGGGGATRTSGVGPTQVGGDGAAGFLELWEEFE